MLLCCSCDNCVSTLLSQVWRSSHSKLLCAKDGFFWSWLGGLTGKEVENPIESFKSYLPHTDLICSPHPCPLIKTLTEFDSITWGSKLVSVIEAITYFTAKHHNQLIKYPSFVVALPDIEGTPPIDHCHWFTNFPSLDPPFDRYCTLQTGNMPRELQFGLSNSLKSLCLPIFPASTYTSPSTLRTKCYVLLPHISHPLTGTMMKSQSLLSTSPVSSRIPSCIS